MLKFCEVKTHSEMGKVSSLHSEVTYNISIKCVFCFQIKTCTRSSIVSSAIGGKRKGQRRRGVSVAFRRSRLKGAGNFRRSFRHLSTCVCRKTLDFAGVRKKHLSNLSVLDH